MKVIEIYSKGCISCDYIYRLQNKLDIYNNIIHYELGSEKARKFEVKSVPVFYIISNEKILETIENPERKDIERIKRILD